ncbi:MULTISPECIES: bifunctional DNA primase/polymerase [unclassified Streptomyces]|uniref:bifunctional DNA primase/polymerase n=1 Tax=unclassified Streptomyces TaxID=2593676 RepID=UPI0021C579D7|nr:bifunctional DNA primase/polymerase [Streptomyces sp. FIT100]UUN26578.1 bifunctional DNA primase/polymerase [Streptomyces sp. FIT100]
MGDGIGRNRGADAESRTSWESLLPQWLRRRPREDDGDGADHRLALLLATAAAGLPLAPAAYPAGFSCSCERIGCPTPARHPVSFAWQTQCSTDPGTIQRWAEDEPEANFVTATGMVHDVLDVPLEAGRAALERLLAEGVDVGPVTESGGDRMLFFTATRGTPEDEDEWWPCELDCHPETTDEHPGLGWHSRGSYVLVPPARLPDGLTVDWVRGPEHPLPDPLTLLEALADACAKYADETGDHEHGHHSPAWPLHR